MGFTPTSYHKTQMSFYTNHGIFREREIKSEYNHMLRQYRPDTGDIGFTWIKHISKIGIYNLTEMVKQVIQWKNTGVKAFDYNNKEYELEGRKWYVLIAQPYNKNGEIKPCGSCVISMFLFSTWVDGYTYAFSKESDRDMIFNLLNTEIQTIPKEPQLKFEKQEPEPEPTPEPPKEKESKPSKQSQTRSANKVRDQKKREHEEYLRRVAEAEKAKEEAEKRKRQAKKATKKI